MHHIPMRYKLLGNSGLKVSELCLGTMTFGRETSKEESFRILDAFADAGGNFIDTADVYSRGASEKILGEWLGTRRREDFVIATKVRYPMGQGPNDTGLSRKHIMDGLEASLERLQIDAIDLYQVHGWDPLTPIESILRWLNDTVRQGMVHYLGASNFSGYQLQKATEVARYMGYERFECLQPQYNLLARATEWELLEVCQQENIGVIPWSPLRGGWLSGKFRRGMNAPPTDSRIAKADSHGWGERWSSYDNDFTWQVIDALHEVAVEVDKEPAQVAINWLMQNEVVTSPIIGVRTIEQLNSNLGSVGWDLSETQLRRLNEASAPSVSYPYDRDAQWQRERD